MYYETKSMDEFDNYTRQYIIGDGTYATMASLHPQDLEIDRWWKSKEKLRGHSPYLGYLTTKKWKFNEVIG